MSLPFGFVCSARINMSINFLLLIYDTFFLRSLSFSFAFSFAHRRINHKRSHYTSCRNVVYYSFIFSFFSFSFRISLGFSSNSFSLSLSLHFMSLARQWQLLVDGVHPLNINYNNKAEKRNYNRPKIHKPDLRLRQRSASIVILPNVTRRKTTINRKKWKKTKINEEIVTPFFRCVRTYIDWCTIYFWSLLLFCYYSVFFAQCLSSSHWRRSGISTKRRWRMNGDFHNTCTRTSMSHQNPLNNEAREKRARRSNAVYRWMVRVSFSPFYYVSFHFASVAHSSVYIFFSSSSFYCCNICQEYTSKLP